MEKKKKDFIFIAQLTTKTGVIFENLFYYDSNLEAFHESIACGDVMSFETETGAIIEMNGDNIDFWMRCDEDDISFFMDFTELTPEELNKEEKPVEKKDKSKKPENKIIDIETYRKNKNKPN